MRTISAGTEFGATGVQPVSYGNFSTLSKLRIACPCISCPCISLYFVSLYFVSFVFLFLPACMSDDGTFYSRRPQGIRRTHTVCAPEWPFKP